MLSNPNLIFYACIAKGSTILAEFSSNEAGIESLAQECIKETPHFHSMFSQTISKRTYTFLIDDPFAYFLIFGEELEKSESIWLLNHIKCALKDFLLTGIMVGTDNLPPNCLQSHFNPIFSKIMASGLDLDSELNTGIQNSSLHSNRGKITGKSLHSNRGDSLHSNRGKITGDSLHSNRGKITGESLHSNRGDSLHSNRGKITGDSLHSNRGDSLHSNKGKITGESLHSNRGDSLHSNRGKITGESLHSNEGKIPRVAPPTEKPNEGSKKKKKSCGLEVYGGNVDAGNGNKVDVSDKCREIPVSMQRCKGGDLRVGGSGGERQEAQQALWQHVRFVLTCLLFITLLGIWLWVCRGSECMDGRNT